MRTRPADNPESAALEGSEEEEEEEEDSCTTTILSIPDTDDGKHTSWMLEAVTPHRIIPPPLRGASPCYWLLVYLSTSTDNGGQLLAVETTDDLQQCSGNQVFRLSTVRNSSSRSSSSRQVSSTTLASITSSENTRTPTTELRPGESSSVGTKLLCEDSYVRIWEFRLAPGGRCQFHRHVHPYLFLNLTESLTQELDQQGNPVADAPVHRQKQGQCTYVTVEDLSAHAVLNVGEDTFLQFVVEFL